jgi:cell division protein FtsZ
MHQRGLYDVQADIKVFGIGGGGCNAVDRMISSGVSGVEFIAVNTDAQALRQSRASRKLQIGYELTRGLGTGGDFELGRKAAIEAEREIAAQAEGLDMAFITCGMGGGTGTGASSVVSQICRDAGALTVAVVTKPFTFEGPKRKRAAEAGVAALSEAVDTVIAVPNDRLLDVVSRATTMEEAFAYADDVLRQGVQSISDIVLVPGVINVDFADVRAIMEGAGPALMGIGHSRGENKAMEAAARAVSSPLLEKSIDGATRLLVNLTGGPDLTLGEANDAMSYIQEFVDTDDGNIILGHVCDPRMEGEARIIVLAAGLPGVRRDQGDRRLPGLRRAPETREDEGVPLGMPVDPEPQTEEDTLDIPAFLRKHRS